MFTPLEVSIDPSLVAQKTFGFGPRVFLLKIIAMKCFVKYCGSSRAFLFAKYFIFNLFYACGSRKMN